MATFKALILPHHKKSDGTYNVKIRVTHEGKSRYLKTPYHVVKEDISKGLKIKNQIIIDNTNELLKKYRTKSHLLGEKIDGLSIEQLLDHLNKEEEQFSLDFLDYGRKYAHQIIHEQGRLSTGKLYLVALNSLEEFLQESSIDICKISYSLLQDYMSHLNKKKGVDKTACTSVYLAIIKFLFNKAKKAFNDEDIGVINIPQNPFKNIAIPKAPVVLKRALSIDIMKELKNICFENIKKKEISITEKSLDVFMLSFMLVGMNSADMYNCLPPKGGFLIYNRTKTKNKRRDNAEISIKLEPEVLALMEKYKDSKGERAFNFYHNYKNFVTFNGVLNHGLKKIGTNVNIERLQFYAARHSWATIATNVAKVDKYTVHEALNHVTPAMAITDVYIKKDFSLIHEAHRKVMDLVFKD